MAIEFNTEFYLQSKFNELQETNQLDEFGLTDVASLAQYFEDNGVDAREHYLNAGMAEGINPSADFDTIAYLEAKLAELQNADKYGDTYANYSILDVVAAFQTAGLTPLEHFNEFGEAEGLEATPVGGGSSDLTAALVALQNAQSAEAEALADIALAVNAELDTPLTGDALTAAVASFTAANATAELSTAETQVGDDEVALLDAQSVLRGARNEVGDGTETTNGNYLDGVRLTDANLNAAQNTIRSEIQADDTARGLLNTRTEAQAALNNDIGVDGSNRQILTDLRTAITTFANAGGDLTEEVATDISVSDLLAEINVALADDDDATATTGVDAVIGTIGAAGYDLTGTTAQVEAINDAITDVEERDTLITALETAQTALEANALGQDLTDVEALIAAREDEKEAVTSAEANLAESQQYFDHLSELVANHEAAGETTEAAREALADLGVDNLVELDSTSTSGTADEADLYLFSADETGDLSLLNFEASDLLFIGEGYSRVNLNSDANIDEQRLGNSSELEVFFQQDGINAVLYIETESFGGNALSQDDLTKITLTGVSIDDLQFENGYVSIVEAA